MFCSVFFLFWGVEGWGDGELWNWAKGQSGKAEIPAFMQDLFPKTEFFPCGGDPAHPSSRSADLTGTAFLVHLVLAHKTAFFEFAPY